MGIKRTRKHKKPLKVNKAVSLKSLQKKAGELWKAYCLKRDIKCRMCGSSNILQVHHVFSRKKKSMFLDTENGVTLCRQCHSGVTWDDTWREKLRRLIDPYMYERLYEQSQFKGVFKEWKSIAWLEGQIKTLEIL